MYIATRRCRLLSNDVPFKRDVEMVDEKGYLKLETIVCISHVLERCRTSDVPAYILEGLSLEHSGWTSKVRTLFCGELLKEACSTYLLPDRNYLNLQFMRSIATVRYWLRADTESCSSDAINCCEMWGF